MANIIKARIQSSTGSIQSTAPPTLTRVERTLSTGTNRLDGLADVVATTEVDGGVPVYDAATDKYVIKRIDANVTITDIDGGFF